MKKFSVCLLLLACFGCGHNHQSDNTNNINGSFIPLDSGNRMISSYLTSINVTVNDTDLRSVLIDAHALRNYLDSQVNSSDIQYIKIMLAHTPAYMNSGKEGVFAGYNSNALTFVLAGVNSYGDYVYLPGQMVVNRAIQCPSNCPPGSAGNNLLTTTPQRK